MKKIKSKKALLIICFILFVYCVGGIVYSNISKNYNTSESKVDNKIQIKGYEYILNETHPRLYKDEFRVLKNNLEGKKIDYIEYAKSISKMFIIDLYNLNYKKNMYDVGGVAFVYPEARENYKLNVTNTLYKYMKDNSTNKRKQELPEVKEVVIMDCADTRYTIDEKEFDGYKINIKIEYVKDLGYDKNAEIIIIRQDKHLYIVEKNSPEES